MTEDFKRKLTAILSADVEGYSRLMGEDEDNTVRTLTAYRILMSSLIKRYHGNVVDSPGDNLLAEFESVRDAVLCAVEIQEELKVRNTDLPDNRKMQFRIGINLGDIIREKGRIYGDGVNVAARIESLADAGGICLSSSAYDQVKKKLNYEYEHLGEYEVKNIDEPVSVYKVLMVSKPADKVVEEKKISGGIPLIRNIAIVCIIIIAGLLVWRFYPNQPITKEQEAIEPEQVPVTPEDKEEAETIAVLPFKDLSPDGDQEYFSDVISDELINKLAQIKNLRVISRTSSFSFKGKNVGSRKIGAALGADYLLEGSVFKLENQLRITVQLIKVADDYHLWSKSYDREMKDMFSILDDTAKAVTTALSVTLGVGEFSRPGMTRNVEAYDEYIQGYANKLESTPESLLEAIDNFKKAVDLDPNFGKGWLELYNAYNMAIMDLSTAQTVDFETRAAEALNHAWAMAPDMIDLLMVKASEYHQNGNWFEAERIYKQILDEQGLTNSIANSAYGYMLVDAGRNSDALTYLQRAKRSDPLSPEISFNLSVALFNSKRIDEALVEARRGETLEGLNYRFILFEVLVPLEKNDKSKAVKIMMDFYDLEGEYSNATILKLAELLLMEDTEFALSEVKEISKNSDIPPRTRMFIAHIASNLGGVELAFESLRKAGFGDVLGAMWHPTHRAVRQLPDFKTYIRDRGLYDYWRSSGEWGDFCHPVGDDDFECE